MIFNILEIVLGEKIVYNPINISPEAQYFYQFRGPSLAVCVSVLALAATGNLKYIVELDCLYLALGSIVESHRQEAIGVPVCLAVRVVSIEITSRWIGKCDCAANGKASNQ
uniref:Uncharacterized protein n=1 Tax=Vespula pensylvanica TaxID=30213 RepID=A0A834KPN5_VESPE|nr:hypothetical protein H0235_013200 [Vespula pensylvanica]